MQKISKYIIPTLLIVVTWAKAGLAGDWIFYTISTVTIYILFLSHNSQTIKKSTLILYIPIIIICILFSASYFNPSFKKLSNKEWVELGVQESISNEINIAKAQMALKGFDKIYKYSESNPKLSIALFYHLKNEYYDKFNVNNSPVDNLIIKYQKFIELKIIDFLPTLPFKSKEFITEFVHFAFQILFGVAVFYHIKTLKHIRNIILIISYNGGLIALLGIFQKLNYTPGENLKEIWGIWDTPEPRYFFASFTYKNHWACYAIITIYMAIALLFHEYRKDSYSYFRKPKVIFLFLTVINLLISIPLSGSRSGTLIIFSSLILFVLYFSFKKYRGNFKKLTISALSIIFTLICTIWVVSKFHKKTTDEMLNNTKIQIDSTLLGNYPLRLMLWHDILDQISEKPILGYGFNSYQAINPKYQSKEVRDQRNIVLNNAHHEFTPLIGYAHNDWLEKISEFGLIGIGPFIIYLYMIISVFTKGKSETSRILIIGSICYLVYSFIDFPSRTPCSLLTFSLNVGLALKYNYLVLNNYSSLKL